MYRDVFLIQNTDLKICKAIACLKSYTRVADFSRVLRLALLQLKCGKDKIINLQNAACKIEEVVSQHKPHLIGLSECLNLPRRVNAEPIPDGHTSQELSKLAKKHNVYLIGGTILEKTNDNLIYNTCTVWDPNGELIAKHRKMHLFDVDIKGGIKFKESEILTAGNELTMFTIQGHKIGIGICYDIRFEEMAKIYRNEGCKMLIYPAAFSMTTGPMHWELLQRSRANDNQLYVATISPARDEKNEYIAYGHSMIVDPWAKILKCAKEGEEILVADIDFSIVDQVRQQIPISNQRRTDLYETIKKGNC